jgi:hypothetical protein
MALQGESEHADVENQGTMPENTTILKACHLAKTVLNAKPCFLRAGRGSNPACGAESVADDAFLMILKLR